MPIVFELVEHSVEEDWHKIDRGESSGVYLDPCSISVHDVYSSVFVNLDGCGSPE